MINNSLPWVSEQDDETLLNGSECACVSHATKISVDTGIKAVKAHKSFPLNAMSSGLGKETEICECVCWYLTSISFILLRSHKD